jgi:hypothetical protein
MKFERGTMNAGEVPSPFHRSLFIVPRLPRLCHDSGAFGGGTKSYLHIAERLTNLARQNEGWLKSTAKRARGSEAPKADGE